MTQWREKNLPPLPHMLKQSWTDVAAPPLNLFCAHFVGMRWKQRETNVNAREKTWLVLYVRVSTLGVCVCAWAAQVSPDILEGRACLWPFRFFPSAGLQGGQAEGGKN